MPSSSATGEHRSVLLHEAVESLAIAPDDVVVDGTLGGAGHALAIARQLGAHGVLIGVDADEDAVARSRDVLADAAPTVVLIHSNVRHIRRELEKNGIERISKALLDLGWSGYQLAAGRGFSFLKDEPLSMAYDKRQRLTAETIVNEWEEDSIADVLYGWGGERYGRRIAERIARERQSKRITTSGELAQIIAAAVPGAYRHGRIHPATRSFQALRIAVNDEMGALEEGLQGLWETLASGGRIAVISFHSIEDRIVKHRYAAWVREGRAALVNRKPIVPSEKEVRENPRSRSAKLRVIQKI